MMNDSIIFYCGRALLYVKAIERDERGLPFNMATLGGNSAEKVSKEIAAENQKLKIDCYNNLSGTVYMKLCWT